MIVHEYCRISRLMKFKSHDARVVFLVRAICGYIINKLSFVSFQMPHGSWLVGDWLRLHASGPIVSALRNSYNSLNLLNFTNRLDL
jgi:hypothetical protein